jgi:CO/xanthine dehydrogenase FAD-binding subunit
MAYARPDNVKDALEMRASGDWRVLAGGTDLYPATQRQVLDGDVLDITAIPDLRGISTSHTHTRIGAATTWTDIIKADLPAAFDGLKQAAREVGAAQIQNAGTIAGNLCNASPAADGVPPLMPLDAQVVLQSSAQTRSLSLSQFIQGNRQTALERDELVTAIDIPNAATTGQAAFLKLGARHSLVISIAMVAARVSLTRDEIDAIALSVGSCSAVAQRLPELERNLTGLTVPNAAKTAAQSTSDALAPITDIRATANYRTDAVPELIARVLTRLTPPHKRDAA